MSISISIKLFKSLLLFAAMFASWQCPPFVLADPPSELTTNIYASGPRYLRALYNYNNYKRGKYKLVWMTPRSDAKSVTGYQIRARYNDGEWTTLIENTSAADSRVEVGKGRRTGSSIRKIELDPFDTNYTPHLAKRNDHRIYVAFSVGAIRGTVLSPISNISGARYYDPNEIFYTRIRQVNNQRKLRLTWNKPAKDANSVISYQIFRRRFFLGNNTDEDWQLVVNHTNPNNRSVYDPIDDTKFKGANINYVKYLYKIKAIRQESELITNNVDALLQPLKTTRFFVDHLTPIQGQTTRSTENSLESRSEQPKLRPGSTRRPRGHGHGYFHPWSETDCAANARRLGR